MPASSKIQRPSVDDLMIQRLSSVLPFSCTVTPPLTSYYAPLTHVMYGNEHLSKVPQTAHLSGRPRAVDSKVADWDDDHMVETAGEDAAPRRGRPGYDVSTVLRHAIDLFNRQGYEASSMGDLARELGLTKSAIYHHVPSKEHLLSAALDEALDALTAAIDKTAGTTGTSAHDRLRAAIRESVEILVGHLPAVTLLLRLHGNSEVEIAALKRRRALDDKLADLVRAAVDEGAVRDDIPPELISRLLFGMVNSLIEWYRPGGPVDPDVLARSLADMAFEGLAAPRPSR